MNKMMFKITIASLCTLAMRFGLLTGSVGAAPFVYETESEFLATGDFNGDGMADIALVERSKGCVRYGIGSGDGSFNWLPGRSCEMEDVTSVAVGKFIDTRTDALAFVSDSENVLTILGAEAGGVPTIPVAVTTRSQGPNLVFAAGKGGAGRTAFDDLLVFSIYNNDPAANRVTCLRNEGKGFTQISEEPTSLSGSRGKRLALKRGGKEYATVIYEEAQSARLIVRTLEARGMSTVLEIPGVSKGSDYLVGNFRGETLREFVFYESGKPTITVCPVIESNGKFRAGDLKTFTLSNPVTHLIAVDGPQRSRLLAVFGAANTAELLDFDTVNPPVTLQTLKGHPYGFLFDAVDMPDGVVLFSMSHSITNDFVTKQSLKHATYYQAYRLKSDGSYAMAGGGWLPARERDYSTVYHIHKNSLASQTEKTEADMKPYTNTIPGTDKKYEMVAIPSGEFLMGSPATEKNRAMDEGPQHRVNVSPFWMGKYEVTWDQYLLFMYPEEEKQLRETFKVADDLNTIADAVTRPSKPYESMDFGMGKFSRRGGKGFPAIAMTQHAANKFCHWLSAKTGHFYRLPTEAEWEYAARAGTTNTYFFGDDPVELPKYALYYDYSGPSFRYEEVGKKKPNPWGLFDIYGNVSEWTLDQYETGYYKDSAAQGVISDPWNKAVLPYPHSVRGGSYDDDPDKLRSAARSKSSPEWKKSDPDLPKSIWWLPDCRTVGFRIVRPLKVPSPEEMAKYWISGVEKD